MQKTAERTLSIFSTIIAVILLMLVSTTRATASNVSDLEQDFPYIYWMPEYRTLALSKQPITIRTIESDNGIIVKSFCDGAEKETHTFDYTFLSINNNVVGDAYRLIYNDLTGWEVQYPDTIIKGLTRPVTYYSLFGRESVFEYYSNVSGGLPDDIPPLDDIQTQINDALNSATNISDQAKDVTNQMQAAAEQFKNGEISVTQFQNIIQNNINITNELSNELGATLADQIAVNNAQNAIQIGQDALIGSQLNQNIDQGLNDVENTVRDQMYNDNRLSRELIDELNRLIKTGDYYEQNNDPNAIYQIAKQFFLDPYLNGEISKNEALYEVEIFPGYDVFGLIGIRNTLVQEMRFCSTLGDFEYYNQIITTIDKVIDGINQSGDVNPDIAESADSQESDEIDLLNNMIQEMEGNEPEKIMNNQQIQQDLQGVSRWIEPMWNNRFITAVVSIFCILVPICVILDLRYRYL